MGKLTMVGPSERARFNDIYSMYVTMDILRDLSVDININAATER